MVRFVCPRILLTNVTGTPASSKRDPASCRRSRSCSPLNPALSQALSQAVRTDFTLRRGRHQTRMPLAEVAPPLGRASASPACHGVEWKSARYAPGEFLIFPHEPPVRAVRDSRLSTGETESHQDELPYREGQRAQPEGAGSLRREVCSSSSLSNASAEEFPCPTRWRSRTPL